MPAHLRQSDRGEQQDYREDSRRPAIINSDSNHLPGQVRAELATGRPHLAKPGTDVPERTGG